MLKITIIQRLLDADRQRDKASDVYTLTVETEEGRVAVNIPQTEAYRTIDACQLTAYDEVESSTFTEYRWDNIPTSASEDK
jgi:hypothetical protein